ncbi:MAG TPA: phosphatase PAP2 family protein [Polyangiales bacterium]
MRAALLLAWLLLWAWPARADEPRPFATHVRVELPLLASGSALWLVSEGLKPRLAPAACRWCGGSVFDQAVQQRVRWDDVQPAARTSDALLFGIVPAFALGSTLGAAYAHGDRRTAHEDVLVLGEALVLTAGLTQLVKYTVARERPFLRTQREHGLRATHGPDDNLSFFSGHTSITFARAVGAGGIASMRGYPQAPWIWAIGVPLAACTGYLRIAADRHYLTDVLVGALVGSAIGVLLPWLHRHQADDAGTRAMAAPPGMLSMSWLL